MPQKARTSLGCSGADFLDVKGLLRGIEIAGEQHMRGREVLNGFGVFDYPDRVIIVGYEDGSLGFPFLVAYRSTSAPAFLDAIRAAGLGVLGSATFITDPTCSRRACSRRASLLRRH